MAAKSVVFVSSSSDLAEVRVSLWTDLKTWLSQCGIDDMMAPYLWDRETEKGRLLRDRMPVQQQLPDPGEEGVPFTICLFGERCGVPLQDKLPVEWEQRIAPWRGTPGLAHPWPRESTRQQTLLDDGCFPLTGTVFELLSALSVGGEEHDNLVLGYVAPRDVDDPTLPDDMPLNNECLWESLRANKGSEKERNALRKEIYNPQVHALLNLLKYLKHSIGLPRRYPDARTMNRDVLRRVQEKLREHYRLPSAFNPFKATLEHWTLDERRQLPGRNHLISQIEDAVDRARSEGQRLFILIKGRSGCGKSSLLQRGVLARFRDRAEGVLSVRPTDFDDVSERNDRLDMLWLMICDEVDGCRDASIEIGTRRHREVRMAKKLLDVLAKRNARFVLGLDQFEEILDDLRTSLDDQKYSRGWWLVMSFLRAIACSPHVQLIATLESSRQDTFASLGIEEKLGLHRRNFEADVGPDDVARIAETAFENAGLRLAVPALEEIKRCWERFEAEHSRDGRSASSLPLVCLWFSRLFDRFEYRASARPAGIGAAMANAFEGEQSTLTLDDIGTGAIDFSKVVSDVANDAWTSATGERLEPDALNEENLVDLGRFLHPLIALDSDGHIRLRAVPILADADQTSIKLLESFKRFRLLVPATEAVSSSEGAPARLRLVHQAVIDHWPPARQWFKRRRSYLEVQDKVRIDAMRWARGGRRRIRANPSLIQEAAQVLLEHRANWTFSLDEEIERGDAEMRTYALTVFQQAKDPAVVIGSSIYGSKYALLAAMYQLVDLLDRFSQRDPAWREIRAGGDVSIMSSAAWTDGGAVPFLLSRGVPVRTAADVWSPIVSAIQVDARKNYRAMIDQTEDINAPAGPPGRTMLHLAAEYGNLFVLEDLLDRGADPRQLDEAKRSALHWAASTGQVAAFKRLMPVSDIAGVTGYGENVVHLAAQRGHANIVRALLDYDDITSDELSRTLNQSSGAGHTPLMEAAAAKWPNVVEVLLKACDAGDPAHRAPDMSTALHLAVRFYRGGAPVPSDEEKVRARRTVELLLRPDTRIDPTAQDRRGRTAFDWADAYEDARQVLRRDPRVPTDYASLTQKMRVADLTSRKVDVVLSLLRSAPQALTDLHEDERGIDILIRTTNTRVLAAALSERLIDDALLAEKLNAIVALAVKPNVVSLRGALIERLDTAEPFAPVLPVLLNAALRDNDHTAIAELKRLGVVTVGGDDEDLGASVFHDLAQTGDMTRFAELAELGPFTLPNDAWDRRPSDLACASDSTKCRELECRWFTAGGVEPVIEEGEGEPASPRLSPDSDVGTLAQPVLVDRRSIQDRTAHIGRSGLPIDAAAADVHPPLLVLEHDAGGSLKAQERRSLIRSTRALCSHDAVIPKKADTVRVWPLPFYGNVDLLEVSGSGWQQGESRFYFLRNEGELKWLNSTSPPIHETNAKTKPLITHDTLLVYLAFFCFFVRGQEGPFLILDRPENPLIPSGVDAKAVRAKFREPRVWAQQSDGKWRATALVYYDEAIFAADFLIEPGGMITMKRDTPILTNLPKIHAPIGGRS
ncbi:nSTAND1 domain-containing NTPase [Caballeronia telluris]|uniref:Ankyrin n=1 Tax=Caballeronia telluris TaxID=326475 RepID=A0A158H9G2_9BURK|nr:ankyrin repeat domain-containing protein [Caballeronia telluris]SAL40958.1 ankyrin [Caballeronia telluris]